MAWKRLKGRLFHITGPNAYRALHAVYFFVRMVYALRSQQFGAHFFGRDLLTFTEKLKPGDRVLDIGAFLGASTVLFGKAVGKKGQVVAFEPVHSHFLRRVLSPFGLSQVSLAPVALAAENGMTEFLIPIHNGVPLYSQSGFTESYSTQSQGPDYTFLKLPTTLIRLDDFLLQKGWTPESIAAVKIDVEGSEMSVFAGGEDFFRRFKGFLMCEFWFNQVPPEGWTWLQMQGYHCRYLSRNGSWMEANTEKEMVMICQGETYGNFFWEKHQSP